MEIENLQLTAVCHSELIIRWLVATDQKKKGGTAVWENADFFQ